MSFDIFSLFLSLFHYLRTQNLKSIIKMGPCEYFLFIRKPFQELFKSYIRQIECFRCKEVIWHNSIHILARLRISEKKVLPCRDLNPGLLRESPQLLPLCYRGIVWEIKNKLQSVLTWFRHIFSVLPERTN